MSQPQFKFELVDRIACKASIMIEGLSGKGKSGTALMIAFGLAGGFKEENQTKEKQTEIWKKVFATDTENKSLNLFVGLIGSWGTAYQKFYSVQLDDEIGYRPSNYLAIREEAIRQKGEVNISDSITHMWNAKGGVLDMVSDYKRKNPKADNYTVWGQEDVAREKQLIVNTMRHGKIHCITTVRLKEKQDLQFDAQKNKNVVVSLGEQQIQQSELQYEPDLVLHMLRPGNPDGTPPLVQVKKTRYAIFKDGEEYEITPALIESLRIYLEEGVDPEEILEKQRQDYIKAMTEYLDAKPNARPIWKVIKKDAGFENTDLNDIPLDALKPLFIKLTV